MSYFVFVEFQNENVNSFLTDLRNALQQNIKSSPIHVTIRGPYAKVPAASELSDVRELLRGNGVRINGHGQFKTQNGFAVFVRAECSAFKKVWDKPDYKSSLESIQPHITLYESADPAAAKQVLKFLKAEKLLIYTYDVVLRVYASRQEEMFGAPLVAPQDHHPPLRSDYWSVREDVIARAGELGARLARSG